MAKPSRWTAEKRYQIVKEALSQKEPMGQIARRHQVSEGMIYRWRDKFFEGGKAALAFDGRMWVRRRESGIGTADGRAAEADRRTGGGDPFFKTAVEEVKAELGRGGSGTGS